MTIIINYEKYGERTEFGSIEEAQQAIRDCGPEFAVVTLVESSLNMIYDQDGQCVGWRSEE